MNKVTIEMTEEEAVEYFRYKKCKGREVEEINELAGRLQFLSELVYKSLSISEESGTVEIINDNYARGALTKAERELF